MDIVIPFVTCKDKVWMKNLLSFTDLHNSNQNFQYTYFYDYGTLKYVLRGIDKFMPYVNNVFLIVSNIEQVPDYVNQSKVKVILHKDFIPEELLPTFQANTIEMFMYNIPGLDEEFVFFNDDTIPISPIKYEELFKNGLPCINFKENYLKKDSPTYNMGCTSFYEAYNTVRILKDIQECEYPSTVLFPEHGPIPYLKSVCIEASKIDRHPELIKFYTSTFRSSENLNQYYWSYILYFLNLYTNSNINVDYITTKDIDNFNIKDMSNNVKYLCINDYGSEDYLMSEMSNKIVEKINNILPDKCKYEQSK